MVKPPADRDKRTCPDLTRAGGAGWRGREVAHMTRGDLTGRGAETRYAEVAARKTARSPGEPQQCPASGPQLPMGTPVATGASAQGCEESELT